MIQMLATFTVTRYIRMGVIEEEDKEIYQYGFFLVYSNAMVLAILLVAGLVFGAVWEAILFYCMFTPLRNYGGGIHAKTEKICSVCTVAALIGSVLLILLLSKFEQILLSTVLLAVNSLLIAVLCPMDTEEKRLTGSERKIYKNKTLALEATIASAAILAHLLHYEIILYTATSCTTLEALLLLLQWVSCHVCTVRPNS